MVKKQIRSKIRLLRNDLSTFQLNELSKAIFNNVLKLEIWDNNMFHIFLSIKDKKEIDTSLIINYLWANSKIISVSKSNFYNYTLDNFLLQKDTRIEVNSWGIPEPVNAVAINDNEIDVVFVPLLSFDKMGNRVGYGKGFYDRFLEHCKSDVVKIGISLFDVESDLIEDVHEGDIALDFCVTPHKTYIF